MFVVSDKAAGGLGFNFSFAPYAGFATEVENSLGYAAGTLAGTMLAVFEDSSQNYSRLATGGLTTVEQLITTANDGSYMFSLGSTGQLGEGWSASSLSDDVGGFALPGAANFGLFNYGLNIIDNVTFINFTDVATAFGGFADLSGSGSLVSQFGFDTPFDVFDNVDMTVNTTVVPEPSTLILLGFGMVGLGVIVRNRRKDS